MMKALVCVSLLVTALTALIVEGSELSCEEKGGHVRHLEPLSSEGAATPVCVPFTDSVVPTAD